MVGVVRSISFGTLVDDAVVVVTSTDVLSVPNDECVVVDISWSNEWNDVVFVDGIIVFSSSEIVKLTGVFEASV